MNILPYEIIEQIFNYIPLVTNKFFFKNLSKTHYKILTPKFDIYILTFKQKNKEWLLIEFLIKEDILAIYFILDDLSKNCIINLILYLLQANKIHIIKLILLHPISINFIKTLYYEYLDVNFKMILDS